MTVKTGAKPKTEWNYSSLEDDADIVNIMYYGDAGTGKTTDLARLAKLGPVVYIEAESGLKKAPMRKHGVPVENLRVVQDEEELAITFGRLEALCDRLRMQLYDDPKSIAGVVWDSVTEIQKKLLKIIVVKGYEKSQSRGVERDRHAILTCLLRRIGCTSASSPIS